MAEPFVDTETDRTKSRWIAETFRDFGKPKTTVRALFYFAMRRGVSDYPICGKLVGEIRICRPYVEGDGERLPKWVSRASKLGFIPEGAIIDEIPGERIFLQEPYSPDTTKPRIEVWINKSALSQLLLPACSKAGATLVSVSGEPSVEAVESLLHRSDRPTIILCLSDLSISSFSFCRDLARTIAEANSTMRKDIRLKRIGLTPGQVATLKIPMVQGGRGTREDRRRYELYLKPFDLSKKKMAELDALEAYYPGGLDGFVDEAISKYANTSKLDKETWLLDSEKVILPAENDIDSVERADQPT
jgi:hypothetical protein